MSDFYNWLKILHILSLVSWMAGIFYLPRLFVYHAESAVGSDKSETFKVMERRLYRGITTPAMPSALRLAIMCCTKAKSPESFGGVP